MNDFMSESEIVTSYRQAKDKKEQVMILSQLNDCSKQEILDLLLKNGIPYQALPRERKPKPKVSEKNSQQRQHQQHNQSS